MLITFGVLAAFFALTIVVLQLSFRRDRDFTEYAVGGRSFGGAFQAMSFLNTWYPGAVFIAFASLTVTAGVIGFYVLSYSLLTIVIMYLMARRVWIWGKIFDLRTQPDLLALRYDSKSVRVVSGIIGIVTAFPWLVLGLQALGLVFEYLSLHRLTFSQAVIASVIVMVIRQYWTIRMGMRGVVISDMVQGVVAYGLGTVIIVGLIFWIYIARGVTVHSIDSSRLVIPGPGSKEGGLYVFSLVFTGAVGGWCWPSIFVRLFTADGVRSMKKAAAISVPLSLIFCLSLLFLSLLASCLPEIVVRPNDVWFLLSQEAGGIPLLALAGVVVFAATVGSVDGTIQATGTQIGNDIIGNFVPLSHGQLVLASKVGMLIFMLLAAWVSCWHLPALFTLAVISYQGIVQLAVPQFLGIFWKRGNRAGALAGMAVGFVLAAWLETSWPGWLPALGGLSSGMVALGANIAVYVAFAFALPQSDAERRRVEELFETATIRRARNKPARKPTANLDVKVAT